MLFVYYPPTSHPSTSTAEGQLPSERERAHACSESSLVSFSKVPPDLANKCLATPPCIEQELSLTNVGGNVFAQIYLMIEATQKLYY